MTATGLLAGALAAAVVLLSGRRSAADRIGRSAAAARSGGSRRLGGPRRLGGSRWLGRTRGRPSEAETLDAVVTLLDRLAALSRAGLTPRQCWEQLAAPPGPLRAVCAYVAESLAAGGSVGRGLVEAAALLPSRRAADGRVAAHAVLGWLAVTLVTSQRTGAPAAECLDRLAASARAEIAAADERAAALAGPRATAAVLTWLPGAGIVLGALVGADPLRALVLTGAGRLCAVVGGGFWVAGRLWVRALVRSAARAGEAG